MVGRSSLRRPEHRAIARTRPQRRGVRSGPDTYRLARVPLDGDCEIWFVVAMGCIRVTRHPTRNRETRTACFPHRRRAIRGENSNSAAHRMCANASITSETERRLRSVTAQRSARVGGLGRSPVPGKPAPCVSELLLLCPLRLLPEAPQRDCDPPRVRTAREPGDDDWSQERAGTSAICISLYKFAIRCNASGASDRETAVAARCSCQARDQKDAFEHVCGCRPLQPLCIGSGCQRWLYLRPDHARVELHRWLPA
jgi:hypothetical protein